MWVTSSPQEVFGLTKNQTGITNALSEKIFRSIFDEYTVLYFPSSQVLSNIFYIIFMYINPPYCEIRIFCKAPMSLQEKIEYKENCADTHLCRKIKII